jgi:hypothetical protein
MPSPTCPKALQDPTALLGPLVLAAATSGYGCIPGGLGLPWWQV